MNNKILAPLVAVIALSVTGCNGMLYQQNSQNAPVRHFEDGINLENQRHYSDNRAVNPTRTRIQKFAQQNSSAQLIQSQTMGEVSGLKERVRRVERAMIRLDRRMQLIEHNALSRINPAEQDNSGKVLNPMNNMQQPMMQPMSNIGGQNSFYNGGYKQSNTAGFKPVAYNPNNNVTSSLQAAPRNVRNQNTFASFPSLADKKEVKSAPSVSIWTINYESRKIWPSREQLPGSREVVETLRNGEQVTIFARGVQSASKEFRDRVRAISRYLGRVSGQKSVSIAAMPDNKMANNVIEIIATK